MQFRAEAFPRSHMHPMGNPPQHQGRFSPHPCRQSQFGRIALGTHFELPLCPTQALEFVPEDPFCLGLGALPLEFAGVMLHQVKVVAHQTIGVRLKTGLLAGLGQRLAKDLPVHILENGKPGACPI